ncbi:MAG: response regulator [Actinomycetota bacterium]|nr:response regulator [Actinomycetota bacterium]
MEAVDLAGQLRPDVVVLDNQMPHLDGIAAIPMIRGVAPTTRIVVFSACESVQAAALEAGACAYVDKAQPLETLVTAVLDAGSQ